MPRKIDLSRQTNYDSVGMRIRTKMILIVLPLVVTPLLFAGLVAGLLLTRGLLS